MPPVEFFDHLGRLVRLGAPLGQPGGEGAVFEVVNSTDAAAKIYHHHVKPPVAKLRAMVGLQREELLRIAAWPTATLHERPGGPAVGFLMRKVKGFKEIHTLYSPAHRKTTFPQADWSFLVTAAMNCAAAMDTVHHCGVVVGDVNQSNVLVSVEGFIALLDCDSCQIQANGQTYPCDVGVPLFTPPELQGKSFRGLIRTPNHDRFGLAVLIFHLLFMGRHPFSGKFLGSGDMLIERAIGEYRFAYGNAAAASLMQPPLHSLPMAAVSPALANLFERAFARNSSQGSTRPTGVDWYNALNAFRQSLRACQVDPGHVYAPHVTSCPWCELMKQKAPNFFISVAYFKPGATQARPVFVLATFWARIDRVLRPNFADQRPVVPKGLQPTPLSPTLPTAVPAKPTPPSILASPPLPPPALTARLPLPAILASPPSPPAHLVKPAPIGILPPPLPAILTSPPSPPAIVIPYPARVKVVLPSSLFQRIVGAIAIGCALIFPPFLFVLTTVGGLALIAFVVSAVLWAMLEDHRRRDQYQANLEYEAEVAELQAAAKQKLRHWREWLTSQQAKAQHEYDRRLAAEQAEAKRAHEQQLAAWQAKMNEWRTWLAGEQEKAKGRYEAELATQQAQLKAYNASLAAEQTKARQRYEEEMRAWQQTVEALRNEAARRRQARQDAEQRLRVAQSNWETAVSRWGQQFDSKKDELRHLRQHHEKLDGEYATERQALQARAREIQLEQYLQQHFISDATIDGIGETRTATLASFGIETAWDVEEEAILQVPGFGPKLTERLLLWRKSVEHGFVFNLAAGVPPHMRQALELKYAQPRQQIEIRLAAGEGELRVIAKEAEEETRSLHAHRNACIQRLVQSELDLAVLPQGA